MGVLAGLPSPLRPEMSSQDTEPGWWEVLLPPFDPCFLVTTGAQKPHVKGYSRPSGIFIGMRVDDTDPNVAG